jgi:transcriptional regulator with XRE-family HTH domain
VRIEEVVGQRVAELRAPTGMTQAELGQKLGELLGKPWSRQAVSAAEKGGRAFTAAELLALAYVLEVPVGRLLTPPLGALTVRLGEDGPLVGRRDLLALTSTSGVESTETADRTLRDLAAGLANVRGWAGTALGRVEDLAGDLRIAGKQLPPPELPKLDAGEADSR